MDVKRDVILREQSDRRIWVGESDGKRGIEGFAEAPAEAPDKVLWERRRKFGLSVGVYGFRVSRWKRDLSDPTNQRFDFR